ncbi:hypothetical protein H4S08_000890 [Coemansia sp. RSA 1365]|nr:hypothetical protein H4S08_000890 [Coemansia sp. RSA 1365]
MSITISVLPHKEQALFRSALKLYETRQYKKGLKTSEQILKKFPSHGESLAVKGMFLAHMDRKEEGYENIKRGLEINPKSSISWHVYGLVCRNDQKFLEAIKCYDEALKADSDNVHILRELSQLQMQTRQYSKVVETREKLVKLNPTFPSFWMGLAVAHQLTGRYDLALKVINAYEDSTKQDNTFDSHQMSELLLYKNWMIELSGDYQGAIDNLKEIRPHVRDITAWKEQKAKLLLKVDRKEAAAMAYQDLIERNPENNDYIVGYLACNGLDMTRTEDQDAALEVLEGLQHQFPSSNRLRSVPLIFCNGENFIKAAEVVAKHALRKGIPSLFSNMKALYDDEAKGAALGRLIESCATQIRDTKRFSDSTEDESPLVLMWCDFYLAQHNDYYGDYERALSLIEDAIRASPDTVELYMVKAKIFKHAGDIRSARDTMDFGRHKDLKDRYINSKTVKYMLRNNEIDEAEKAFLVFVRDDAPHKLQELCDIQATWYMRERGHAYRRLGDLGRALKQFHQVTSSFDTYQLDQFDFHSYSLRKATLRTYADILEWEDTVYTHPCYVDSAKAAVGCYIELFDLKQAGNPFQPIPVTTESKPLTRNSAAQQGHQNISAGVGETKVVEVDKDLTGATYVNAEDHMVEALKLIERLESEVGDQPETHILAFEVHLRMKKYFLVLKAINTLRGINAEHPALSSMVVRLGYALDADESFAAPMKAALKGQLSKSFGDTSIEQSIESHGDSLEFVIEGSKGLLALGDTNVTKAKSFLLAAPLEKYGTTRTLLNLQEVNQLLKKCNLSDSERAEFAANAKQVFPLATCF